MKEPSGNQMYGPIFDTHAHYDMDLFDEDRKYLLSNFKSMGIVGVINMGVDIQSSIKSIELANQYDYIYAGIGIHPENLNFENIDKNIFELSKLIGQNKVVCIGEIGLDYHYATDNIDIQRKLFESQIKMSKEYDIPIAVHDREAHNDTLDLLLKYKPKGIVHCFSGDLEIARQVVKIGMNIGVGGLITFKNAKTIVEVVKEVPLEKIVLETDAPYMTPVPFRGKRCDSSHIKYTARKIAEIKQINIEDVFKITTNNAFRIFKLRGIV